METKSRYEVIAELEEKKRSLIINKFQLDKNRETKIAHIEAVKKDLENAQEDLKMFDATLKDEKATIDLLIKSAEKSLERFQLQSQKKQN